VTGKLVGNMKYDIIQCGDHKIYKIEINDLNNESIIKELSEYEKIGIELVKTTDILTSDNIRKMYQTCYKTIEFVHGKELGIGIKNGVQSGWIFQLPNGSQGGNYHKHEQLSQLYPHYTTDIAWVYYLQIPNNLIGDEGTISFKDEFDNTISIIPELNYVYAFPANLLHKPNKTINSTKSRIVAVANIKFYF
jgi:hypothetical protein